MGYGRGRFMLFVTEAASTTIRERSSVMPVPATSLDPPKVGRKAQARLRPLEMAAAGFPVLYPAGRFLATSAAEAGHVRV
jgi:hypothetical protein